MSDVLTLKYRPDDWKQVIGQDSIVRSFRSVLKSGSNRTFLLAGPSGTGKTTLARIAAKEVGCEPEDVLEIDAATYTGIDDMRAVTSSLSYRPLSGAPAKAIIIDECHRLSGAAWASLLKSLEEPPEWVYWFLCTTDIAKVPGNIETRCTKYWLKSVDAEEIFDLLSDVAAQELMMSKLSPDDWDSVLRLCAKEAAGSPRAALVNLGAVADAKSKDDARRLLKSVSEESSQAHELARALTQGLEWRVLKEILVTLKDENPEGVRHVVRQYITKVILESKTDKGVNSYFAILEQFSQPFASGDGLSPLVLACGRLAFA